MNEELEESKAFAVKVVVCGAVSIPILLVLLHFAAAVLRVDFNLVKEVELILACIGILSCVIGWAFKK